MNVEKKHGRYSQKIQRALKGTAQACFFAAFGLAISCKMPDDNISQSLEPVAQSAIEDVLYSELEKMDVRNFKVGQQVHYEMNYRVEMSPVAKLQDILRKVFAVDLSSDGKELKVSMREDFFEWNSDGSVKDEKHSDVIWRLKAATTTQNPLWAAHFSDLGIMNSDDPAPEVTYEYYNLYHRPVVIPAPKAASQKSDCGGLENCVLRATEVSYIVKVLQDGQVIAKAEQKTVISRDVPPVFLFDQDYILPVFSDCLSRVIEDKYFVTTCMVLRDLQK